MGRIFYRDEWEWGCDFVSQLSCLIRCQTDTSGMLLQISLMVADDMFGQIPPLEKDMFFGEIPPDYLPYTQSAARSMSQPHLGSTADLRFPSCVICRSAFVG